MLSVAYRTGDGVAQDWGEMMRWARLAAEGGSADAQNTLGYGILTGLAGHPPDVVEACAWLMLAVERAPPGELRERARVNVTNAMAQLDAAALREAEARAQHWRDRFRR
ncbi:hypothetical protein ACE7GA_00210 [Roseomonas sp. CCTCC AB2023176]|uniref:hypothetical protein n=1 Tax=Roseomonas sp. CCTCC AB2023176 TaxID=3342640 RepID=UPI0035E313BB